MKQPLVKKEDLAEILKTTKVVMVPEEDNAAFYRLYSINMASFNLRDLEIRQVPSMFVQSAFEQINTGNAFQLANKRQGGDPIAAGNRVKFGRSIGNCIGGEAKVEDLEGRLLLTPTTGCSLVTAEGKCGCFLCELERMAKNRGEHIKGVGFDAYLIRRNPDEVN